MVALFNLLQPNLGCIILIVGAAFHGLVIILIRFEIYRLVGRKTLRIWSPNEFELNLLCVYSPAHALMWMITSSTNWIVMVVATAMLSKQVSFLVGSNSLAHTMITLVACIGSSVSWLRGSECNLGDSK
jgi:hypothetical protein